MAKETSNIQDGVQPIQMEAPFDAIAAFSALETAEEDSPEASSEVEQNEATSSEEMSQEDDTEDENQDEEDLEEQDDDELEEDPEEDSEEDDNEIKAKKEKTVEVTDDTLVEVVVNGETDQVSIKDLRRLAGQEKALTRKSMAVAAEARKVQAREEFAETRLKAVSERVNKRAEQYANIDFVALAQSGQYTPEQIEGFRQEAKDAEAEAAFVNQELEQFYKEKQESRQAELVEKGKASLEQFEDIGSPYYIEDFKDRYQDLSQHAVSLGISEETILTTPDPWFWKLLDDSLRRGSAKETLKTASSPKKDPKAKKLKKPSSSKTVLKSRKANRNEQRGRAEDKRKQEALKNLQKTGSKADALAAFAALGD